MKNITLEENSIFSVQETNLMGKKIDKPISSYHFILEGMKELNKVKDAENYNQHLYEYSAILKQLVKNEMLEEMRKRIDNIDTFYS